MQSPASNIFIFLIDHSLSKMPKVKRSKKPPPEGWELIEPTLEELEQKMREGRNIFPLSLRFNFCNFCMDLKLCVELFYGA